uniref:Aminotransferase-like plant mobile domain-containing protein n=1 Tax=Fagus sylvatica TaxID=28930 RepID=A0A2N9F6M6_FAGSY
MRCLLREVVVVSIALPVLGRARPWHMLLIVLLDTGKEYDAMETSRERADHDADDALPTPSPGIVIGEIARSFGTTHRTSGASTEVPSRSEPMPCRKTTSKRSRVTRVPPPTPTQDPELVRPRVRYPPQGGIRPRDMGPLFVVDTPLLTNLANHPSTSVRRCEVFNLTQTLCMISCFFIPDVFFSCVCASPIGSGCGGWSDFHKLLAKARPEFRTFLVELGFGPFPQHSVYVAEPSSTLSWVYALEHYQGREALAILGFTYPCCLLRPHQCLFEGEVLEGGFGGDIATMREYDWGALTYDFYIRGLRRFSHRETSDSVFSLARHWDWTRIKWLTTRTLLEHRTEELFMAQRSIRQLDIDIVIPVDPPPVTTIEGLREVEYWVDWPMIVFKCGFPTGGYSSPVALGEGSHNPRLCGVTVEDGGSIFEDGCVSYQQSRIIY